ncbi:MAG TPA: L-idonate 5-dehydrogenase [Jiangellaceae bacterium]|nr:L-idonate 5-dehydrogenase [Jiangellaceae bacterium]
MKALVIHGKHDLRVADLATPSPGDGQVRLRMAYVGICGSDLHYYNDGANGEFVIREPLVPGHEVSAVVDLDPSGTYAPGTAVTVHPAGFGTSQRGLESMPHLWPGGSYLGSASTWPHTQGGMSEYLVLDATMVRPLPVDLPLRRAALAEPLAVALHGIAVAGGVHGKDVLVSGSGPIGLLSVAAALWHGAREVVATDLLPGPLERARHLGAERTVQVDAEEVAPESSDVVLECSGAPSAINASFRAVRRAGIVAQVGMVPNEPNGINLAPMLSKEAQLRGSFRFNDEIDDAVRLLAEQPQIESVITHEFPADDVVDALEVARDSAVSGKVIVSMWHQG